MPVDKPSAQISFLNKVGFGFTIIDNEALGAIGDAVAVGVWVHLCAKPQSWRVNEKEVCKSLSIGRDRYRRAMRRLREIGLVWDSYTKDDKTGAFLSRTVSIT